MAAEARVLDRMGGVTTPSPGAIVLKERLEILPNQPLPEFATPWATAFAARDLLGVSDSVYALMISDALPCRENLVARLMGSRSRGLFDVIDFGSVVWSDGRRRLAIFIERPAGPALMPDLAAVARPMPFNDLIDRVFAPIVEGLGNLTLLSVTHRGIRPSNVFKRVGSSREYALGDFLSGPPGAAQPAMFETVESAMSLPSGRGPGDASNDIFSLGVTMLMLYLGRNPVAHMNEVELMASRLANGSFTTLMGSESITGSFRDLLRGMLQDDRDQRWSIEDLSNWIRERRGRIFVVGKTERALRPMALGGQNFYACRPLAAQLAGRWRTASLSEKKVDLVNWLTRSIQETSYLTAIAQAFDWRWAMSRKSVPGGVDAGINARICVALDRRAPVRYKSFAAFIDGMGPAIAASMNESERLRDVSELMIQQLPEFAILLTTSEDDAETASVMESFRRVARAFSDNRPSQGPERALYELNRYYPCQSPLLVQERVTDIAGLLPALERVAASHPQSLPVDRHIAAFIAAHFTFVPDEIYTLLASPPSTASHVFGVVGLVAALQAKLGPRSLPQLAHWLEPAIRPVIGSFHRRATRDRLEAALPAVLDDGDFTRLQSFIVGADHRRRDRDEFQTAVREYARLEGEVRFVESGGASSPEHAREYGHMMGAWLAMVLGLAIAAATLALTF